jgi:hypothetical protein
MSWTWFIYTPLPTKEVLAVVAELDLVLAEWVDDRGEEAACELAETCGEVVPGGPAADGPPSADDVVRINATFGHTVDPLVLERLQACRSSLAVDRIHGSGVEHPLQVSILRFLVQRVGACLVDWGDHQIALGERVLADLEKLKSRGRLGADPGMPRKPIRRRKPKPGEVRSLNLFGMVEHCAADPDLALDLRRLLPALSPAQLAYLRLLETAGAMDDKRTAAELSLGEDALNEALLDLDAKLRNIGAE